VQVFAINHPSGEIIPLLVDEDGLPIPSPNEFILSRRSLSTNTLLRNTRELAVLYRWLKEHKIDLDLRIRSNKLFSEAEINGSLVEYLRKDQASKKEVVSPHTFNLRLTTIRQYLIWLIDVHVSTLPMTDVRYELIHEAKNTLIRWTSKAFINAPKAGNINRKSLSEKEVNFLLECLHPENPEGFARFEAIKHRNYVMISLMLNCGLRPGELLSLRVEDIQIGAISAVTVTRRPPDPKDTRKPRPSIKRNSKIIPIEDPALVRFIDGYIVEWREVLESTSQKETDYLILSDEGQPLSHPTLTQLFTRLRATYPNELPETLTPKALRHTFSCRMEQVLRKAGLEEDRRRQALALLRGDSSLESQTVYIAQEIEDQARKALSTYQKELMHG